MLAYVKRSLNGLTRFERGLWAFSAVMVAGSFLLGSQRDWLTLAASLVGVSALIFVARGDVLGQVLTVVFGLMYAVISWEQRYYGEMITYLGMTAPIAVASVVTWLRHPYEGGSGANEVKIAGMSGKQLLLMGVLTAAVTAGFYFILRGLGNANLLMSTVSIATSFLASWLMMCRNSAYALAYAANDAVLITLWIMASVTDPACLPMVVCFGMFLLNDLYGFVNWRRMQAAQACGEERTA